MVAILFFQQLLQLVAVEAQGLEILEILEEMAVLVEEEAALELLLLQAGQETPHLQVQVKAITVVVMQVKMLHHILLAVAVEQAQ
jgi:hypothetical protein